jgi:nucleotide-binding universal stress UspA family protein
MAYRCIVCGVTGSAHAQSAALEAAALAKEHNARLIYVYAVDTTFLRGGVASQAGVQDSLTNLGNHILDMAEELAKVHGVSPVKVVRKGPALDVLRAVVAEEKADLLMLGHEKRTFFEKALFHGEVEEHIREIQEQTGVNVKVVG